MVSIGKAITSGIRTIAKVGQAARKQTSIEAKIIGKLGGDKIEAAVDEIADQLLEEFAGVIDNPQGLLNMVKKAKNSKELLKILLEIAKVYKKNWDGELLPSANIQSTLDDEEYLHALIAQAAYAPKDQLSVKGGVWSKDKDLSDDKSIVYFSEAKPDTAIIGYRGTKPTNASDVISDIYIALGETEYSTRFQQAMEKYDKVKSKYKNITLTGHSLGGSQALYVGMKTGAKTWAFNPGFGADANYPKTLNKYPNIKVLKVKNDPVSLYAGIQNMKNLEVYDSVSGNPLANHSMGNFLGGSAKDEARNKAIQKVGEVIKK